MIRLTASTCLKSRSPAGMVRKETRPRALFSALLGSAQRGLNAVSGGAYKRASLTESSAAGISNWGRAMVRHSKLALVFSTVILSAQAAAAAPPDAKLFNAAASKWGAAGKETSERNLASETRSYDYSGSKVSMKSSAKDSNGKETNFSYSAGCDGKAAPMIGNPKSDSISLTCVSSREIKATSSMKGKVTVESRATVSADGKHLTIKRHYVGMKGAPTETLEFDR